MKGGGRKGYEGNIGRREWGKERKSGEKGEEKGNLGEKREGKRKEEEQSEGEDEERRKVWK